MLACSFQSASSWTRPCCISTRQKCFEASNVSREKSPLIVCSLSHDSAQQCLRRFVPGVLGDELARHGASLEGPPSEPAVSQPTPQPQGSRRPSSSSWTVVYPTP